MYWHSEIGTLHAGRGVTPLLDRPKVPCGIFDDPKLVAELKEACATIAKAIVQVNEIFAGTMTPASFNQATRWINSKEEHCGKIITLMAEYCLCQRVKPVGAPGSPFTNDEDFTNALKAHHIVMQCAMKAKQSTDPAAAAALECAHRPHHVRHLRAPRTSLATATDSRLVG